VNNPDWAAAGFSANVPIQSLPQGVSSVTLAAHTVDHGTWLSTVGVVVPNLGPVPARAPVAQPAPVRAAQTIVPLRAEVQSPQPGDQVSRGFVVQVLASGADRVDVFLEPDRDQGGRLVGSAVSTSASSTSTFKVPINVPLDGHTLYVHVSSTASRQEQVLTVPIIVRS
jgi:hypothetical protein